MYGGGTIDLKGRDSDTSILRLHAGVRLKLQKYFVSYDVLCTIILRYTPYDANANALSTSPHSPSSPASP